MPTKKSLKENDKKLTDFFPQKPSTSLATSSAGPIATTTTMTRRRPATRSSTAAINYEFSTHSSAPPQTRDASTTATRKRPRSPDSSNFSTSSLPPSKPKSSKQPVKISRPNLHAKRQTAIVDVTSPFPNSPVRQSTPAQAHKNTLVSSPSDSSKQVVCSSQSDEAELVLPIPESRDRGKVEEGIHAWRQKTSELFHSSCSHEDTMEVDTPPSSPIRGSPVGSARSPSPHFDGPVRFAEMPRSSASLQTPIVASAYLPLLPNTDELPPLPPTPEPIDPETKTAKLIAEVRARAFAANQSSDDEKPLEFRELEDSDDDDLIDDLFLINNPKEQRFLSRAPPTTSDLFSSPLSSVPSTVDDASVGRLSRRLPDHCSTPTRSTRSSTRTRKSTVAFRLPVTIVESSSETQLGTFLPKRKKPQATNPLHALLCEKESEDKRGTSFAALRLAEEAIKEDSRERSIDSDDEFDIMNRLRFADEQAAWKAVHELRKSTTPVSPNNAENFTIGDRESKMLGTAAGEAIGKILARDKASKGKEKERDINERLTSGISLWMQSLDEDMELDPVSIAPLTGHPILNCLDGFVISGNNSLLELILRSGALAAVPQDILLSNIPQLLHLALFGSSHTADAVFIALRDLWELNSYKVQIPFAAILFVLVRLGANPSTLDGFGFPTGPVQKHCVSREILLEALKRLFAILKAAASASAFFDDDVANIILVLVIVGLDPVTSSELRMQLDITLDIICNHCATGCVSHDIQEKILSFARPLAPINKARLVSFFASGSCRARHIARRLAYCILVSVPSTPSDQVPPLEPLLLLLSPAAGSGELFDITNESTDYEELRHYVNILSVALIDIAPYVEEEKAIMKSASIASVQGSPNKHKKPPVPPLELLRGVLDILQGKIVDTRAAHLDRSRMKAAIQRLTLRIHYNRMALIGLRQRRRASTLKAYFSPQRQ